LGDVARYDGDRTGIITEIRADGAICLVTYSLGHGTHYKSWRYPPEVERAQTFEEILSNPESVNPEQLQIIKNLIGESQNKKEEVKMEKQVVNIQDLAEEYGTEARDLRVILRTAGFRAPESKKAPGVTFGPKSKYEWEEGSEELKKVKEAIEEALESREQRKQEQKATKSEKKKEVSEEKSAEKKVNKKKKVVKKK
jgi:hypothetical protein